VAVYQIIIEEPSMELITQADKNCRLSSYCAEGNILMFGWTDDSPESLHSDSSDGSTGSGRGSRHFINVRKMALDSDQDKQDMVVELSHRKDMVSL
jgi:hypothetical protein